MNWQHLRRFPGIDTPDQFGTQMPRNGWLLEQVMTLAALTQSLQAAGLRVEDTGTSRNWLFAAAHPFFTRRLPSRKKYTAQVHWLGWSAYLIAARPA